ncbi:hypothetical protein D3C71_1765750 [compost metagenome]
MNRQFDAAAHEEMLLVDHAVVAAQVAALLPLFRGHAVIAFRRIGAKARQAVMDLITRGAFE